MSNINRTTVETSFSILLQPTTSFLALSYSIATSAIVLNGIEIKLIFSRLKRATDFEIVLLNLSIADLINSLLFIAVTAMTHCSIQGKELRSDYAFYWITRILTFSVTLSVSFVAVIGIERFFAVKLPLQHRLWHTSRRNLIKYIILTWLFDVILIATLSIVDHMIRGRGWKLLFSSGMYVFGGVLTFGSVLILLLYSWVLYLMVLRTLKSFDFDKKTIRVNHHVMKDTFKKEKSSIIICILVVASFLGCNTPLIVDVFKLHLTRTSAILLKLSAVLNPLIYFFKVYLEKYYAKKKLISTVDQTHD